jgi:hypothetical protein
MRRIVNALCFALAFAIPAWVAVVAYPFGGPATPPYVDAHSAFTVFCLYALVAGAVGGAIYSVTLTYLDRNSSIAKSVFAGILTLLLSFLSAFLLAFVYGAEWHWLRGFVLVTILIGCAFGCAFLFSDGGLRTAGSDPLTETPRRQL